MHFLLYGGIKMHTNIYKKNILLFEKKLKLYYEKKSDTVKHRKIPDSVKLDKIHDAFLYTYQLLQGLSFQQKIRKQVLEAGLVFQEDLKTISQMKLLTLPRLTYIAKNETKKLWKIHLLRGIAASTANHPIAFTNIPLEYLIYLEVIQIIGLTFGYEMNSPFEMFVALNLFFIATLPKGEQYPEWMKLKSIISEPLLVSEKFDEKTISKVWLTLPLRQMVNFSVSRILASKAKGKIPWLSIGYSTISSYLEFKRVFHFILYFYQYRYLLEKKKI
jgi:hypothetical protein